MTAIIDKLHEGGPFFTYPILFLLILILALIVKGILSTHNRKKILSLISSLGWFTLAWGVLGQTFGLIKAFDAIQVQGEISRKIITDGLKIAMLTTLFGLITFLIARLGIILMLLMNKEVTSNS